jgi:hypothetical protein
MKVFHTLLLWAAAILVPSALHAQFSLPVAGRKLQVHSFASQGFAYSGENNFLTMRTSEGSFAFTDGGINASMQITDKFRVGAQGYARNVGRLGQGHVELDWAVADYKIRDWLGVRGGKVKTSFGLYNDTQDMDFLHTWAVLPQSLYPIDLRSNMIAHTGIDVYGEVPLRNLGSLSYTAYYGARPYDPRGGYFYGTSDNGAPIKSFSGRQSGVDVRWNTPLHGVLVGTSWMNSTLDADGVVQHAGNLPYHIENDPQHTSSFYADFQRGSWHFAGEYRRNNQFLNATVAGAKSRSDVRDQGFFVAAAYRLTKRLEVGAYNSRYYIKAPQTREDAADHIFDQAVTARFDISRWWNFKVEGHLIRGYGDTYSAHGFYAADHPGRPNPETNMIVLRSGWNF